MQKRPAAGWPDVPHSEEELRTFIREAFVEYERAAMTAQSPSGLLVDAAAAAASSTSISSSSTLQLPGASSSASSPSHVRTRSGAKVFVSAAASTAAARLQGALVLHVESQMREWRTVMQRFEVMANAASFSMQMRYAKASMQASLATLLTSDDLAASTRGSTAAGHAVRTMSEHVTFGGVLAQMAAECAERTRLLEEVDRRQREQQQLEDEQAEQAALEAAVPPSELGVALAELDAVVANEVEEDGADVSSSSLVSSTPSSAVVQSALRKLRASALLLVAAQRAAAEAKGDDGQRKRFDTLYQQLVNDEVAVDSRKQRQLAAADAALLAKLKKGKTRAAAAVLDAAVKDWALLDVMREDARVQQECVMQEKLKRRAEAKAAKAAERREQARRNVVSVRRAARTVGVADALLSGGESLNCKAPRLLVPLTLAGRTVLPEEVALRARWQQHIPAPSWWAAAPTDDTDARRG
jgi:hypothetical protein